MTKEEEIKLKKTWFKFYTLLLKEALQKFPKDVNFKILSSFIQRAKLGNEFKAIFDIMSYEFCTPSF
jgi:hypothetical protein